MTLSIITICQDEAELLPEYFENCAYLHSKIGDRLKEIVMVDGGSKDSTVDIIKHYRDVVGLPIHLVEHPFDTFGQQKNRALEKVTGDYIFGPDADMTWSKNVADVILSDYLQHSPIWDVLLYFTARDKYHYFREWPLGVNMRFWKRGLKFSTYFHERLEGQINALPVIPDVYIFENSNRQSDAYLLNRGKRYQKFIKEMTDAGCGPGSETRYLEAAHTPDSEIEEFPEYIKQLIL